MDPKITKILRLPEVSARTGMSRSQIFRLEKAGQMPPRIFLSLNVSGWSEYEIELWLRSRVVYYRKKVRT